MSASGKHRILLSAVLIAALLIMGGAPSISHADDPTDGPYNADETQDELTPPPANATPAKPHKGKKQKKDESQRKYFIPDTQRTDAGVFHVAFAIGGNFYIEPMFRSDGVTPTGNYFTDLGFQGGIFFDYDYSEMSENIPLSLRGFIGYKYILASTNVFDFDFVARYMIKVSDTAKFGIGGGISNAVWYREDTSTTQQSEILFLPSAVITAGFDFTPFMVNVNWLVNRLGADSTIMGWELYFGFRL